MFCEATIEKWETIQGFFSGLSKSAPGWIFRGHADSTWVLNTSLQRTAANYEITPRALPHAEWSMLTMFKRRAHHYLQQPPKEEDDIEWLSILQHHGGITRLLDCTRSFYIALFFALESSLTDACVWCISAERLKAKASGLLTKARLIHTRKVNVEDDLNYHEGRDSAQAFIGFPDVNNNIVIPVTPYRLNERMAIQQGIFLFPTNLAITLEDNLYSMFDVHSMDPLNW